MPELKRLIAHYYAGDPKIIEKGFACVAQWRTTRESLWQAKKSGQTTEDFWYNFLISDEPNDELRQLVELFMVVVLSSVECERLFSAMNLTKDKMRTRMLSDLLNDLMMIKLNGPSCHGKGSPFDAEALTHLIDRAYELWKRRKVRCEKRSRTEPRVYARKKHKSAMESVSLDRETVESSSDHDEDECRCGSTERETSTIFDSMHTFAPRTILEVPEGWELVVGFTTDSVNSILAQVNQNSHNKVKIAIQFEDGWNVDGWCVRVEKGLCKHYKDFKSWMWVSLLFSGEPSRSLTLCELQSRRYGIDKDCSWCVLKKQEGS